jgi:hypothetical protein
MRAGEWTPNRVEAHMKTFRMFVHCAPYYGDDRFFRHCAVSRISEPSLEAKPSEEGPIARGFLRDALRTVKLASTLENFDGDCFYRGDFTFVS